VTAAQILTIVLASVPTMIMVVIGILVNNAQLSDFKSALDGRFNDLRSRMTLHFNEVDRRLEEIRPRPLI
jgi:hypothetical protein